ncbi:MAG: hypothetical protein BV457_00105 [Thermoplasmata archaeon M9B1D]|nr:MAG: hypothetical protein BV457_00105 [Thermoplasmata archaeon M9B1D]PNX52233.1 MAG: hypothetical protein BV456_00190 [Thermoplasmata archaeon M8B2D]
MSYFKIETIEDGKNGFRYFPISDKSKFSLITTINTFKTYCNNPTFIIKNKYAWKIEEWERKNGFLSISGGKGLHTYEVPEFDAVEYEKVNQTVHSKGAIKLPEFKVITYTEDDENPSPVKCIVFDGKGYLIKEDGRTIERF